MLGPGRTVLQISLPVVQLGALLPSSAMALGFASMCHVQVTALAALLNNVLLPERQPQAVAAFASSAAKPAALLPWLATLSTAVSLVATKSGPGECAAVAKQAQCAFLMLLGCTLLRMHACCTAAASLPFSWCCAEEQLPIMSEYLKLLFVVFTSSIWAKHCEAVVADPAVQRAIVQVLVDHCLPATAEELQAMAAAGVQEQGAGWLMLLRLSGVLRHSSLRPALARRLQAPGAAAAIGHAAAILSQLPASRSGSMPGGMFSKLLLDGTALLGTCLTSMVAPHAIALQHGSTATQEASQTELSAAGWHAVRLMPRLAASLAAELDDPQAPAAFSAGVPVYWNNLSVACAHLAHLHGLVYALQLGDCSPAQLAAWLAAVTATLQLLPRLLALDVRLKQHSSELNGAEACCTDIMPQLVIQLPRQLEQVLHQAQQQRRRQQQLSGNAASRPANDAAAWGSLPLPLWALHTALCRLIAALTAPVEPLSLPGEALDSQAWRNILFCLNASLIAAVDAHRFVQQSRPATRIDFLAEAPR